MAKHEKHNMKDLLSWTLETIRSEDAMMSWLEERRYEWAPVVGSAIAKILEGQSVLILSDLRSQWFTSYIIERINRPVVQRPILPFFSTKALYPAITSIKNDQEIALLFDMLALAYPQGYFFWYIGKANVAEARVALRSEEPLLWIMDEEMTNSFALRSSDELIDLKLLQLFRLFDKTLNAALFAEVTCQ